jgi:hypothetical protein
MALLGPMGWNDSITTAFNYLGQVASNAKLFLAKKTDEQKAAEKAEAAAQKAAIAEAELNKQKAFTRKIEAVAMLQSVWNYIIQYWYVFVIAGVILFIYLVRRPIQRMLNVRPAAKRLKTKYKRKPRSRSVTKRKVTPRRVKSITRSKGASRKKASSGSFRRKIKGKVYTSKRAWAAEMQRLRKRKR